EHPAWRAAAAAPSLRRVGARLRPRAAAGEGEPQDRAVDRAELPVQRTRVVGQPVSVADVPHAGRDLGVAAGGHVGVEMMLDLKAQVAGQQVKHGAAIDVRRAEQLAHVPSATRLAGRLLLAEGVGLVGEVAAEDDRVRPYVAHYVRGEVRGEG